MGLSVSMRRMVGSSALELPIFGFGSAHLGELYAPVDEAASRATLEAAWSGGVRYFDTAPWYGRGLSEHRLGAYLRALPRADFAVTTKVGRTLHRPRDPSAFDRAPWTGGLNFEVRFDYSYDGIMRSYEQALQRLALDRVEALVIHDLDAGYHDPEAMERHTAALETGGIRALEELKAAGDVRAFGMGANTETAMVETASRVPLDFLLVAMPYTLLDQAALHTGMSECLKRKLGVIIGAPFASGILVTGSKVDAKYGYSSAPQDVKDKVRRIEAVCDAHDVSLPAAALQFPLAHPAVASIIPGASAPGEVTANLASLAAAIPGAFWSDLRAGGLIDAEAPVPA